MDTTGLKEAGMDNRLHLRSVCQSDMDLLFVWANDDTVRKNAFHTEKITYENHVKWFSKMLADKTVYQYILCEGECPIGQIRLNVEKGEGVIDYSICAAKRGKGYGSRLLQLIRQRVLFDKISDVTKLTGQVKYENTASARAFERCGFTRKEKPEYIQFELELLK
ncbi:MAG: GNAT family N-acetyltransferase [Lachnospiraceae bacterium]|nr:GNAT family N-acetyltransferase [Lachnospiraceae bacterium]